MKKIIFAAIVFFSLSNIFEAIAEPYWPDNIRVEDVMYPTGPTIGRHEIVDATLDREMGKVDVNFMEKVDKVVVSIVDETTGVVVSQKACDTSLESATMLDVPTDEGFYKLHIEGAYYEGVGYFAM